MNINNIYIDILIEKQNNSIIKIPKRILPAIIQDKQMYRSIELWLELKPLFYDGRFKSAKSKAQSIADFLEISLSTYYRHIKKLEQNNLIRFDNKGDLILCSWKDFFLFYGVEYDDSRKYKFYRVKNEIHIRLIIRQLLIEANFKKQKQQILYKVFKNEVLYQRQLPLITRLNETINSNRIATKDKQRTIEELTRELNALKLKCKRVEQDPEFKRMKNNGILERLFIQSEKNFYKQQREFDILPPVNFDVSISCRKTAELFGLKSQSSGYYWQQFLKLNGRVKIHNRSIFIPDNTKGSGLKYFNKEDLNFCYYRGLARGFFRRLNNDLKFDPLVTG